MASIYRRSYWSTTRDGRKVRRKCSTYTVKYIDAGGRVRTVTGYTDKEATAQLAARLEKEAARRIEKLTAPCAERLREPIRQHVDDYVADLEATGHDEMYSYTVGRRLRKLFDACAWKTLADIDPNGFASWRAGRKDKAAAKTLNQYLDTARSFIHWCIHNQRMESSPLACVERVDTRGKEKRKRRAFTLDELDALLAAAGDRALIYKTALYAQLRRADVVNLRWTDVRLDVLPRYLVTRPETSKGKRECKHPLRADLAAALAAYRPADTKPTDPVFPRVPSMDVFKKDLLEAGIDFIDALGRRADFHALGRQTPNTMMANANVPPRTAMELMRHTDIKLTMGVYTDTSLLEKNQAVEALPAIGSGRGSDDEREALRATGSDGPVSLHHPLHQNCTKTPTLGGTDRQRLASASASTSKRKSQSAGMLGAEKTAVGIACHHPPETGLLGLEPRTF